MTRPPYLITESMEAYNASRNTYINSSLLLEYSRSPIMCTLEKPSTAAMDYGTAIHKFVLEGPEEFAKSYIVGGPINKNTGATYGRSTVAFADWLAARPGMGAVSSEEFEAIKAMRGSLRRHQHIAPCLEAGWAEGVVRAKYYGADCQIRIDWLTEGGMICDLKTCEDIEAFKWDLRKYGYGPKASFYQQILKAGAGELVEPDYRLLVVEKNPPYRSGVWVFPQDALDAFHAGARGTIAGILESRRTGIWPTGFENIQTAMVD